MDVPRKGARKRKIIRWSVTAGIILVTVPTVTILLGRLKPAAPTVEAGTVWPGTVKRGDMLRQVRGLGTLVPEEILAIPATTSGRVERKLLLPGALVNPQTILLELTNPELQSNTLDAEWQVKAAEADYLDLKARLEGQYMEQEAAVTTILSQYTAAKLEADRDIALFKEGLRVEITMKISKNRAEDLLNRHNTDKQRLETSKDSIKAQLDARRTRIDQLKEMYKLRLSQVDALRVRAGTEGVLQQVTAEVGQQVAAGATLARVVQPWKLKAELRIPETQAKDVLIGQPVQVDTRNGIIAGKVSRIDPAARDGTVAVDAVLLEALPKGARPDLNVEGTIELERLTNVLFVERPVFGQEKSTVSLFKMEADGKHASRAQVKLGRGSVSTIEVLEGLKVGDKVILSDMSAHDNTDRIVLN
ncbi:MAG: efflux RND transporter periplasmic adaptor subunit [Bryobacteraceae bacterium]